MKIDCTLDALMLAALPTYQNEFGTKKLKGGLLTDECADDAMLPFRKMRPYEVLEDSETTEIQHNAVFAVKTAGVTLTLHDSSADFLGCEARILNISDGSVTVKGGVSGLDGGTAGITVPAKREMRLIWLSDGWHSSYSDFANITARELADGAATIEKGGTGATTAKGGFISLAEGLTESNGGIEDDECLTYRNKTGTNWGRYKFSTLWTYIKNKILGDNDTFNRVWPVGSVYTQYPQQASPNELWGSFSTWEVVDYDGAFFRAAGGNANDFIEKSGNLVKQGQSLLKHSHTGTTDEDGLHRHYFNYDPVTTSGGAGAVLNRGSATQWTNEAGMHSHTFTTDETGEDENRPDNFTVRIWLRTA